MTSSIIITGASRGLGRLFALALRARHPDAPMLLIADRKEELESVGRELGGSVDTLCVDLATVDGIHTTVARIQQCERVALLVNNAGCSWKGAFADVADHVATMTMLHALAPQQLCAAMVPVADPHDAAIINVASIASYAPLTRNVGYCASKGFLRLFSEGIAGEFAAKGIYVQTLCPGFFRTEHHAQSKFAGEVPGFLWMRAEDVVEISLAECARRRRNMVIPGATNRLLATAMKLLPVAMYGWAL